MSRKNSFLNKRRRKQKRIKKRLKKLAKDDGLAGRKTKFLLKIFGKK